MSEIKQLRPMFDSAPIDSITPATIAGYRVPGCNWSNQIWLASALAHMGYIVAAINHPGTTTHDRSPQTAA